MIKIKARVCIINAGYSTADVVGIKAVVGIKGWIEIGIKALVGA